MSFSRQVLSYGFGLMVSKLQLFALLLIVPHFLSPEEYGIFDVITSLMALITVFITLNLDTAVGNYYNGTTTTDAKRKLLSSAIWTSLLFSLIALIFIVLTAPTVSLWLFKTVNYSALIVIAGFGAVLGGVVATQLVYLRYRFLVREHNIIQVGASILTFVLTLVLIAGPGFGVYGVIIGNIAGTVLAFVVVMYFNRYEVREKPERNTSLLLLKTGLVLMPFTISSWALSFIDRSILLMYRPIEEVGVYGLAVRYAQSVLLLFAPFQSAWLPYALLKWQHGEVSFIFNRVLRLFMVIAGFAVIVLGAVFQFVVLFTLPASYHEAVRYIPLLCLCNLLTTLYYFPWASLMALKKSWAASLAYLFGAVINVLLCLMFIPGFGIAGATWSTFIGYLVMLVIMTAIAQKYTAWTYPYKKVAVLLISMTALATLSFLSPFSQSFTTLLICLVSVVVYAAGVWLTGFFRWVDAKTLVFSRLKIG